MPKKEFKTIRIVEHQQEKTNGEPIGVCPKSGRTALIETAAEIGETITLLECTNPGCFTDGVQARVIPTPVN